jgi:gamma-glutamylcyclotransferase (GGCT)/AIG2-like uncharacterized protein YtfP
MEPTLLFAYGTLAPGDPAVATRDGWVADRVRGRLFDLGPYPALIDCGDAGAGWVEGYVRPVGRDELTGRLDPYEGVDEGLYRRTVATTEAGRPVWVYVYARSLPPGARGPLARWGRPRTGRGPGAGRIPPDSVPDCPIGSVCPRSTLSAQEGGP